MSRTPADDIFDAHSADFMRDGSNDIVAEFSVLTHVLAFEAELVLLGQVVSSQGTNLVHDVE
jgi:hypothetical protein